MPGTLGSFAGLLFNELDGVDDGTKAPVHSAAFVPVSDLLADGSSTSGGSSDATAVSPGTVTAWLSGGGATSTASLISATATTEDEVAFISAVKADGTLAYYSFGAWNDGTIPADYSGGYTYALKWGGNTAGTAGGTVYYYFDPSSNWSSTEQYWLAAGLALWSAVANISFVQTTNAAQAGITFKRGSDGAYTSTSVSGSSSAGVTGSSILWTLTGATISIDTSIAGFGPIDGSFSNYGGYVIMTLLHEEGHALGLGHAGPYNGDVDAATQQFSAYDSMLWSIMSYIDPGDKSAAYYSSYTVKGTNWSNTGGYGNVPTTWMPLDILAIQRLYGVATDTPLSGGQVFGFNCNITGAIKSFFDFTVNTTPIITLWDLGTGNTLDLSGFSTADTVSLVAGTYSSIDGLTNNIAIAFGTAIDTLVCGSGNTTVTCNSNGDTVYGGAGNDTITGGSGNDTISGGKGTNILNGGSGFDTVSYTGAAAAVSIDLSVTGAQANGSNGTDTLSNFEGLVGSYFDDTLAATGLSGAYISGSYGNDTITVSGNTSAVIDGGGGDDTIQLVNSAGTTVDGGDGTDTLVSNVSSSSSAVTMSFTAGSSTAAALPDGSTYKNIEILQLTTGAGNDTITFTLSNPNVLSSWNGGAGDDTAIISYAGSSFYINSIGVTLSNVEHYSVTVGDVGSYLTFTQDNGTVIGGADADWLYTSAANTVFLAGAGADFLVDSGRNTTYDGGAGGYDVYHLDRSWETRDISLTFTQGASTAVVLPDGTNFKNVEALVLTTGSGNDAVTFVDPYTLNGSGLNSWDGGSGTDVVTVDLSMATSSITTGYSYGSYAVTRDYSGSKAEVLTLTNVETLHITTGSGNDVLTSGTGNDVFDGGLGTDKVIYTGTRSQYTITRNTNGTVTVTGPDGTDTLTGIEQLVFSDQTLATGTGPTADANGDGMSDIFWQNDSGQAAIWTMNGLVQIDGSPVGGDPGSDWHVVGVGDFNGDGYADILWQNDDGQADIWTMNGLTQLDGSYVGGNPGTSWHIMGTGDFNGDGKADILWQNDSGQAAIWTMNGLTQLDGAEVGINPGSDWHVICAADFDGDGKSDILWQNDNGQAVIWLMDGFNVKEGSYVGGNPGTDWHVVAAADFNGDGKADILWQNDNGQAAIWTMDGLTQIDGSPVGGNPGSDWHIVGAGDYNGDGYADILWQNDNGQAAIWTMNGLTQLDGSTVGGNPGTSWHVIT